MRSGHLKYLTRYSPELYGAVDISSHIFGFFPGVLRKKNCDGVDPKFYLPRNIETRATDPGWRCQVLSLMQVAVQRQSR